MRRRLLSAAICLLVLAAGTAAVVLPRLGRTTAAAPPPPVPVTTAPVEQRDVAIVLQGLGTVQALKTATIKAQVSGLLTAVEFKEGQEVKAGAPLAQIDPAIFRARLDAAKAQLARDAAQLANTRTNLDRNKPLLERGAATAEQVADLQARADELRGTLDADRAAVDEATIKLGHATLRAPFDGVTGIQITDIGNIIHPDDQAIVVLNQVQPIDVLFTLPTNDVPQVQAALARGAVAAKAYSQDGRTLLDAGTLVLVNNQADVASGTVQLKAEFPNARRQLWPGAFVNAEVVTDTVKDALTIPTDAIGLDHDGQSVFVVGPGSRVGLRRVTVGQRVAGTALVSEGLRAGETVVVKGQFRLQPGTAVAASAPADVPGTSTASLGMLP